MGLGKRAVYFSLIAFMILSIFIVLFTQTQAAPKTRLISDRGRIEVVSGLTKDISDVYVQRMMLSSAHAALLAILNYTARTGLPVADVDAAAEELMQNGTLYGVPEPRMSGRTLPELSDAMEVLANRNFRVNTSITFYDIRLSQVNPWLLTFSADVLVFTNYSNTLYDIAESVATNISIIGMEDPLFLIYGQERTVQRVQNTVWNFTTFMNHLRRGTYRAYEYAPSYLMRMENQSSSSACCGIESLLNFTFGNYDRSYVDYLFWNRTYECTKADSYYRAIYNITSVWDDPDGLYFRVDQAHFSIFNFTFADKTDVCP